MKLTEILTEDLVLMDFDAPDKWAAIAALPATWVRTGQLAAASEAVAREALLERERRMTTGMEHGIAIPHAALEDVPELLGVLAIAPAGIPFASLDGAPASILWGLLIPRREKLLHIRTLAAIAEMMSRDKVRHEILRSASAAAVLAAIRAAE